MHGHPTDDFPKLLAKFASLIDAGARIPKTEENGWKNHGQLMLIKVYGHLQSIAFLAKIDLIDQDAATVEHIDHSSIAVLGRATYETYVLFHFIFCCDDPDQRQFRQTVWRMSGVIDRSKLNKPRALPPEIHRQIAHEAAVIKELRAWIKTNPLFEELKQRDPKGTLADNVLRGNNVRLGRPLIDLATEAGLPREYAADMYTHFCNYSHAGAISVFQLHDSLNHGSSITLTRANLAFCCALLCQMVQSYTKLFPEVQSFAKSDKELQGLIETWQGIAHLFKESYAPSK